jgi:ribosomal protein L5
MAKPIKETPTLKGKDAKKFLSKILEVDIKKIDDKKLAEMKENFSKINSIIKKA